MSLGVHKMMEAAMVELRTISDRCRRLELRVDALERGPKGTGSREG